MQLVQPETLLRWPRDMFRSYWRKKSKAKTPPQRVSEETVALIQRFALENRLWGAEKIRGELLKLSIHITKRTLQKYLPKNRRSSEQTWTTFLRNHAQDIFVCDFTVFHDVFSRPILIFVVMHLATRQIAHHNVTRHPTKAWTAQQMRERTPWNEGPKYLICDNDTKFGEAFMHAAAGVGPEVLQMPPYTPQANGHCARLLGSLKHEGLDHMLIFHEKQLGRVVKDYVHYYNSHRPHQGLGQQIPPYSNEGALISERAEEKTLVVRPFLNGLPHSYAWASQAI